MDVAKIVLLMRLFGNKMIIGIDPSVNKSGIAVLEDGKLMKCFSAELWHLFDFVKENSTAKFYIENSNLDNKNWHGKTARGNVGKNKGVSQIIVNYLTFLKADYKELLPNGYSLRFKDEKLFQKVTGYDKQTNKDARAAACMIFGRK